MVDVAGLKTTDWAAWAERWEAQQQLHIPRREERFEVMLELVTEVVGTAPPLVLDLACGPGSISRRVLQRFPETRVVALDADPLLLEIGKRSLGEAHPRLRWVQADLRKEDWSEGLNPRVTFDAVLTSTAMHWLAASDLVRVYRTLAEIIRPGGIFLNAEHLMGSRPGTRMGQIVRSVRTRLGRAAARDGENWDSWWEAARTTPSFAPLLAERDTVFSELHPRHDEYITAQFHEESLAIAGFAETAVVWRFLDDTIVAAIR
jgi:SAM-dependent methyltransferase